MSRQKVQTANCKIESELIVLWHSTMTFQTADSFRVHIVELAVKDSKLFVSCSMREFFEKLQFVGFI